MTNPFKKYGRVLQFCLLGAIALAITFMTATCSTVPQGVDLKPSSASLSRQIMESEDLESADDVVQIWWSQGFLPEENEVISNIVADWEAESGYQANLTLLPDSAIIQDIQNAINEERAPDVFFSFAADTNLIPQLAWNGELADISDVIQLHQNDYSETALQSVFYQNQATRTRSYYALPFGQNTIHLHYWKNYLEEAGFTPDNIPTQWDAFWQFWQGAQDRLRSEGNTSIYGLGLCLSNLGTDTFWPFEQFLEAYNVEVVDPNGQLQLDSDEARAGIAAVIDQFAQFYTEGYVPPAATTWTDSGNNFSFLEGQVLMTANSTLSIPFTQRQPETPYNQMSNELYFDKIHTVPWPQKPDGETVQAVLSIKQLAIIDQSELSDVRTEAAKSFLEYFSRQDVVDQYLQTATKGRIFPVIPALFSKPFWNKPDDPHSSVALAQYQGNARPSYQVFAPAYSQVLQDNVWANAILRVIEEDVTPEQAADEAIAQIKSIFAEWL
ncbi:MAG: ABC transporter substrate-binding protein [Elainellaceae cyanobacterium]